MAPSCTWPASSACCDGRTATARICRRPANALHGTSTSGSSPPLRTGAASAGAQCRAAAAAAPRAIAADRGQVALSPSPLTRLRLSPPRGQCVPAHGSMCEAAIRFVQLESKHSQEYWPVTTSWQFFAIRATTRSGFTWHWYRMGTGAPVTSGPFDFYFDCVSDARKKGYAGRLPAGPKVPLARLPTAPVRTIRVSAVVRPEVPPGAEGMTVTPVSAIDVRKRRTTTRSDAAATRDRPEHTA